MNGKINTQKAISRPNRNLRGWTIYKSTSTGDYWENQKHKKTYTDSSKETPLVNFFKSYKMEIINNNDYSRIIWVVANSIQNQKYNETVENISKENNIDCFYERRGSLATNGRAAYRIMKKTKMSKAASTHEIIDFIGCISDEKVPENQKKSLMIVSWYGHSPTYDLRKWNNSTEKLGRGISMTEEELRKLKDLIDSEIEYLDSVK